MRIRRPWRHHAIENISKLEDHIVVLRADVDLAGVPPGSYFLGIRQPQPFKDFSCHNRLPRPSQHSAAQATVVRPHSELSHVRLSFHSCFGSESTACLCRVFFGVRLTLNCSSGQNWHTVLPRLLCFSYSSTGTPRNPCVMLFVSVYIPTIAPRGLIPCAWLATAAGKSMDVYPSVVFRNP